MCFFFFSFARTYRREIAALIAENNAMERQIFSFQKSISGVNARGTPQPMNVNLQYGGMQPSGHQSSISNSNSTQHRVSDPYILDNLTAPFNSLINKVGSHQIVSSSNHPSPSHHSKTSSASSNIQQQQQQQQIKTGGGQQTIHQSSSSASTHQAQPHQTQQQQQTHQLHQSQFQHAGQPATHLNKNTSLSNISNIQQSQLHQTPQSSQQMNPLNSSMATMNLQQQQQQQQQNSYAAANMPPPSNNSPTMTMQQQYQMQQMNLNQMQPINWQQQPQNINPLMQQHLSTVNRSTGHLPGMNPALMNPATTTINPVLNYSSNTNQMINSSNASGMAMTSDLINTNNQLNAGQPLNRHLSNSTCNLNQAGYTTGSNMTNPNAGLPSNSNLMGNLNKPISSSNHNLNNLNQSGNLMQYGQNGQQRFTSAQPPQTPLSQQSNQQLPPNHFRNQQLHHPQQQPMMSRNIYDDQRMYMPTNVVQQPPKSPLYNTNNELNYS